MKYLTYFITISKQGGCMNLYKSAPVVLMITILLTLSACATITEEMTGTGVQRAWLWVPGCG
jgi:hypothetical protein